jgi:hypothetical protein
MGLEPQWEEGASCFSFFPPGLKPGCHHSFIHSFILQTCACSVLGAPLVPGRQLQVSRGPAIMAGDQEPTTTMQLGKGGHTSSDGGLDMGWWGPGGLL